ncbi:hypothetical protein BTA51_20850 [Hahella sp. CCB-MM4]|uniref:substrate-binding periplasmic protein n=1 Tax=Hahella sp. (strain CCB-MM4) TaxID=1926491 RepID=UPI000B9BA5C7|nr:transporter substrate-binding domain-containing protein [Hahella sp. CCB-MM4]OZG71388.1 hypothetical protein BTA51_20850 [Hahella sp. CCB-MM4]
MSSLAFGASKYLISVYPENPPFLYNDNGKPAGMYLDIVLAVFGAMDQPVEVQIHPFRRALQMAYDGKSIVAGILKTSERLKYLEYSDPIYQEDMVVFSVMNHPKYYQVVEDMKGRTFGVILGWSYGEVVDKARDSLLFNTVDGTLTANILATDQGTVDGFLHSRLSGLYQLQVSGMSDRIRVVSDPISKVGIFIAAKKGKYSDILHDFNDTLTLLKGNGTLDKIIQQYSTFPLSDTAR